MLTGQLAFMVAIACSFAIGLTVNLGSTCAVSAAKDLVHRRQGAMMVGFGVAVAFAGLFTLIAKWAFARQVHLAGDPTVTPALIMGAVLIGIGAVVNGGCMFGTLGRIGNGQLRFLGLPLGLAIGFALQGKQGWLQTPAQAANPFAEFSTGGLAVLAAFLALLWLCWRALQPGALADQRVHYWTHRRAMLVLGLFGAVQYMFVPGSTYADAIHLATRLDYHMAFSTAVWASLAALAGTFFAGYWSGRFRLQVPDLRALSRPVAGGILMGLGAPLIPGGNDTLLLSYLPGATLGGLVAYLVMTGTVFLLLLVGRRVSA